MAASCCGAIWLGSEHAEVKIRALYDPDQRNLPQQHLCLLWWQGHQGLERPE